MAQRSEDNYVRLFMDFVEVAVHQGTNISRGFINETQLI